MNFDQFIEKLGDLLQKIHHGRLKPNDQLPKDLDEQLANLERSIRLFCQFNANVMSKAQISDQEIKQILRKSKDTLPLKTKRMLERVTKLKEDAEGYSRDIAIKKRQIQRKQDTVGKQGSFGQRRRKKFKALGGQDWLPL